MNKTFRVLSTTAVLFCLWLGLTLSFHIQELILGLAVSLLIAFATNGTLTGNLLRLLNPLRFIAVLGYIFYFAGRMVMANIDILFRVLQPIVPIKPGIVRVPLTLENERARNIVANSITLTPGTLTVEMTADSIFVHWICLPEGDVYAETQKMVDGFARRLERIIE